MKGEVVYIVIQPGNLTNPVKVVKSTAEEAYQWIDEEKALHGGYFIVCTRQIT